MAKLAHCLAHPPAAEVASDLNPPTHNLLLGLPSSVKRSSTAAPEG